MTASSIRRQATARFHTSMRVTLLQSPLSHSLSPETSAKKYVLTGPEAISSPQATWIIGATIGKRLRFVDESPEEARARRVREGVPPAVIESILAISAYQRAGGKIATITNTVADLTGRPPRTFNEFAHEYAAVFRGELENLEAMR